MRRVPTDKSDDDPGSKKPRLVAPPLLGEISLIQARQENEQQGGQQQGVPQHGNGKNSADTAERDRRWVRLSRGSRCCVMPMLFNWRRSRQPV